MAEVSDPRGVFQVRASDDVIEGVTVSPLWERYYPNPQEFCKVLSKTIRAALPAPDEADQREDLPDRRHQADELRPMELERSRSFWNNFHLLQRKLEQRRERALAGELPEWEPPEPVEDEHKRWGVDFDADGRFAMIGIAPEVFENASAAMLSNLISEALRDLHLNQGRPADPEWEEITELQANCEKFLAG